jgi:hypothetical protein
MTLEKTQERTIRQGLSYLPAGPHKDNGKVQRWGERIVGPTMDYI